MSGTAVVPLLLSLHLAVAAAQAPVVVRGTVADARGAPVSGAVIRVLGTELVTTTDDSGRYRIGGAPPGRQVLTAQRPGYEPARISVLVPSTGDVVADIRMTAIPLMLQGLTVTAEAGARATGEIATASVIETEAIRHQTATSLRGVLELLPGVDLEPPSVGDVQEIPLRATGTSGITGSTSAADLAAFGTLVVLDGVPLSNNANLQSLGPRGELSLTTTAGGGVDLRRIPAATLDRVEVIRGVPSVRYGDLTQGAIIVDTRAGVFEPEARVQYDALSAEATLAGGWTLGGPHTVTANLDYARTRTSPGVTGDYANRVAGQLRHAARGVLRRLTIDSRLDFYRMQDDRPENPNTRPGYSSESRQGGLRILERGELELRPGMTLTGTASVSRDWQHSFAQAQLSRGAMPITDRLTAGRSVGQFVLGSYTSDLTVDGDPWLVYGRLELAAGPKWLGVAHAVRAGAEFRREWNHGKGYQFDVEFPPQVLFNGVQGYDRPRSFAAIPPLASSALYVDDRLTGSLPARVGYALQVGLRVDALHQFGRWLPVARDAVLQPRAYAEVAPRPWLRLRGGWGRTSKAPSLADLYPAPQYNDVVNVNWFANQPDERLAVLTTFVFDPTNPDLGFSTADKAEAGIEVGSGRSVVSLVAYHDRVRGGVGVIQDLTSLVREHYQLTDSINGNGIPPQIIEPASSADTVPIVVQRPANHITLDTRGIELTAMLPEIPALRTRIQVQGSWVRTDWRSSAVNVGTLTRFSDFQLSSVQRRAPYWVGVRERGEKYLLTYRIIHHQPALGLVVTATIQHNLKDLLDDIDSRDTLAFAGYVTRAGQLVSVPPADRTLPQYQDLRVPRGGLIVPQATPADWMMGLQVSKTMPLEGELRFWAFNALDRVGRYATAGEAARLYGRVQFGLEVNMRPGAIVRGW